ncbi:MAG: MarR family transcriptional regulator [Actinomycetota bacterium]|nr:MarR family transcriptional regulator [Actinomycetota bacterium]
MSELIHEAGFTDVTQAQWSVFRFGGPDGRRPTEIAALAGISKQAVNDGLRHLEALGYLNRAPHPDDGRARVVRLTDRGRELQNAIRAAGSQVEREWQEEIGEPEWSLFCEVLDRLAEAALEIGQEV